jgi:hypothetical protein
MRECARRYHLSPTAIANATVRIGRQAMAAHAITLTHLQPRTGVVFDGLRSFVTSQDYPCDITTVVDAAGEMILSMTHSISRRGGRMTPRQRARRVAKERVWRPEAGSKRRDISLVVHELWKYLRPELCCTVEERAATIDTDEDPVYRAVLRRDPVRMHFGRAGMVRHIRTPGSAPRTVANRLFPVNYVDRLLRHRMKEHTRETIAFGRNAVMQMHRAWVFAYDHNCHREWRVKRPEAGVHAVHGPMEPPVVRRISRSLFTRRYRLDGIAIPETIRRVWTGEVPTPPVRWRVGQRGTSVRIPAFALRDIRGG